jgi:outer membrane receptor protein involved in Fe transport
MNGETLSGVPPHEASLWNKFTFNHIDGPLKGLDVGLGVIYHDAVQIGDGFGQGVFQEAPSVWRAPVFVRLDGELSYPFKWGTKTLRAQVNVKNIANRLNWTPDANFVPDGNGREFIGSVALSF